MSSTDTNWPANIAYQGVALTKRLDAGQDSADVKYVDSLGKFIAITTVARFGPKSTIQMWESTNGINFNPSNVAPDYLQPYLHNSGLSGNELGHITATLSTFLGYAYDSTWLYWNLHFNPITISNNSLPAAPYVFSVQPDNGQVRFEFQTNSLATSYTIKYGTQPGVYPNSVTGITASAYTLTGLTNGTKYYFVMNAINASGTSIDSQQVSAAPLNYQPITLTAAAASSTLAGYPVSNVINGNVNDMYSSQLNPGPFGTEWIYVNAASNATIGRLILTARQPSLMAAPHLGNYALIQVSNDGSTWFQAKYNQYSIINSSGVRQTVIDFPQPVNAKYVRYYTTLLSFDSFLNYFLQIAEIQAYSVPDTAFASSFLAGWEPIKIMDLDSSSNYSSNVHFSSGAATEWVGLDLGSAQSVTGINLTPRANGYGFPINFSLQSSNDNINWTTVPGKSYTSYPNPGNLQQSFNFTSPVTARYFRVYATLLSSDGTNYYLQMAQMYVKKSVPFTATASSNIAGWVPSNLADGSNQTAWSSAMHATANFTESVTLDMGSTFTVRNLRLIPLSGYPCFPESLNIQSSTDGVTWTPIPGQNYILYKPDSSGIVTDAPQLFWFSTPVSARYFKITGTKLTPDSYGNYYFQLADIFIDQ